MQYARHRHALMLPAHSTETWLLCVLPLLAVRQRIVCSQSCQLSCSEWEAESPATDESLVYTMLTRPLLSNAPSLSTALYVKLQCDARFGIVKCTYAESARAALGVLNGANICGQVLAVTLVDPLHSFIISKRARVAE